MNKSEASDRTAVVVGQRAVWRTPTLAQLKVASTANGNLKGNDGSGGGKGEGVNNAFPGHS